MGRRRGRRVPKFSSKRKLLGDRKYRRDRQKPEASVSHDHSYAKPFRATNNISYEHRYINFFLDADSDDDFVGNEDIVTSHSPEELLDSDLCSANQFYVVLDKIYEYDPYSDLDNFVSDKQRQRYSILNDTLSTVNVGNFLKTKDQDRIRFVNLYNSENPGIKTCVTILPDFTADVRVHRISISKNHRLWFGLPHAFVHASSVVSLLEKIETFSICVGNFDSEYQNLVEVGVDITNRIPNGIEGFREQDFGAVAGNMQYNSSIRSKACDLLVNSRRCYACMKLRVLVRNRSYKPSVRRADADVSISSSRTHASMSTEELKAKLTNMRSIKNGLQARVQRLTRKLEKSINEQGTALKQGDCEEMLTMMKSRSAEVSTAFPDKTSFQRLFWDQQMKCQNAKDKRAVRWHPMIIKWCLFMQNKSSKAYRAAREAGFIELPSERLLFDYSHITEASTGFRPDALDLLKEEAKRSGKEDSNFKRYVGLLQDEIKVKSDLVYDKHTGELIGYLDLNKFGNTLNDLENEMEKKQPKMATHILVIMVRGIANRLKFPLAAFATDGITADLLYGIMWKAIELVEFHAGLKVIFITCDGASPNRRFFEMHRTPEHGEGPVFYTQNVYALDEERDIFFISDVPHLLKTARNCFANSFSHKKSRKLWFGKNISWMHIVNLYTYHVEGKTFSFCPKLTRSHIDLTSFSCMKVALAAQVLSSTVADALMHTYGDNVSETVHFIQNMNKFFDVLNTRNLNEGKRTRNPNLAPYTDPRDPRLQWLETDFLGYFQNWKQSVETNFGNHSQKEKSAMQLSHQTLAGLEISVRSIAACVRFLLNRDMPFVLTNVFNQDPLEGHFGHYRHKGGANDNPTVYQVRHTLSKLRTVGSLALAPIRGNTKRGPVERIVDDTPMKRRR